MVPRITDGKCKRVFPTVQGELESALARIVRMPVRVYGAGRTDAGVHARGQVAHFHAEWSRQTEKLQRGCNAVLPPDIAVTHLETVDQTFHARHWARSKTYVYTILNRSTPSPLHRLYSWHVPYALNVSLLKEAADHVIGTHDFAAFGSPTDGTPSTVREILEVSVQEDHTECLLGITLRGTGFLRYMVRSLVGTLVDVGRGRTSPHGFPHHSEIRRSLAGRPHCSTPRTLPLCGALRFGEPLGGDRG